MRNWRILLGGAASAAILAVGVAAPAFAQSASRAVRLDNVTGNLPDNNSIGNDLGQGNSSQGG